MIKRDGSLTSLWQATTENGQNTTDPVGPAAKPIDVIIAGGGITGLSTALLLQEAGLTCVLLEAASLCFGSTGGTTAHLNTILDTPYPTIVKNFGEQNAALVARAAGEAIALIRSNCEKYRIDAGFEEQIAYLFSQTEEQTKSLEEMRKASEGVGIRLEYVQSIPVPLQMQKAVAIYDQAKFHPTRYVFGLAKAFRELGGRIIEQCRVNDADENGVITVHTDKGDFACSCLVYATHIPPGINLLHTLCAPYRSYAMAVSLKGDYPAGLIYDMHDPYHYYRSEVIDGKLYFIAGGEDHKTGHVENTETCFLKLESYLRAHFPVDEVVYKWSSQYFEPVDGLPYIGRLPGYHRNILTATGFSGNGMIFGTVAALVFREMVLKLPEKYSPVFDPGRVKPIAGFSHFIKENVDVAKQWLGKILPSKHLASFADLAPGEGRVVKVESRTVAIYKSDQGELNALSPTCPHLGCHVAWNSAEKTWDCPCHGARYSIEGTLLTGPASHNLEIIDVEKL